MNDLTTLQLARKIADAVFTALASRLFRDRQPLSTDEDWRGYATACWTLHSSVRRFSKQ